jgi:hypothetical protein
VSLKIFDILGKEVAVLVNEVKEAGRYSVQFNASRCASGMYFSRLECNGRIQMNKMTLIK